MGDKSKIEWTDASWNPVTGCTRVSAGCDHCYIDRSPPFRMNGRRFDKPGVGGTTGVLLHPERLDQPLRWRKPRKVFVNSLSDLFHDDVPDEYIARVWAVMALSPQHTFQILSKRPGRMRSLLNSVPFRYEVVRAIDALLVDREYDPREVWRPIPGYEHYEASTDGRIRRDGKMLVPVLNPRTGRYTVSLWTRGVPKTFPVHRLVMLAHDPGGQFDGAEVCHRNGDKRDNRRVNLRWGTRSENQREKVRHGAGGGPRRITAETAAQVKAARGSGRTQQDVADEYGISRPLVSMIESGDVWSEPDITWPLPNVWLGVSVEDQKAADLRIPTLLQTPAAVRFLSCEPLLGPVDLESWLGESDPVDGRPITAPGIDWVIAGGESGRDARPMHPDWARALRDQCVQAGVAYLFKQWGEHVTADQMPPAAYLDWDLKHAGEVWPEDTQWRVGKKRAGRLLDGRTWDEYPEGATA